MLRAAVERKQAEEIDDGRGVWGHVHVDDLVELYEILLAEIVQGTILNSGTDGSSPISLMLACDYSSSLLPMSCGLVAPIVERLR